MSAKLTAEIKSRLDHPIIDADGHWVEYAPVFAERMRKVAGDKAADGFLTSQRRIPDALGQMFGFGFPVYQFGLQLRLPIRNRSAAADLADSLVNKKRDTLAVRGVEQRPHIGPQPRRIADPQLSGCSEQHRHDPGRHFVLQAQQSLVSAESALVQNSIGYKRSVLDLLRRTGELLDERGIQLQ